MHEASAQRRRPLPAANRGGAAGLVRLLRASGGCLRLGVYACLWTFVLVPGLHNFDHARAHRHQADAGTHDAAHAAGVGHSHSAPSLTDLVAPAPSEAAAPTPAPPPARHGHGSLEHFGAALLATTTFVFLPLETPSGVLEPRALSAFIPARLSLRLPPARGPPQAA